MVKKKNKKNCSVCVIALTSETPPSQQNMVREEPGHHTVVRLLVHSSLIGGQLSATRHMTPAAAFPAWSTSRSVVPRVLDELLRQRDGESHERRRSVVALQRHLDQPLCLRLSQ